MDKKIPSMNDLGLNELDNKDKALYMMWESSQARAERTHKRQFVLILILILALIGTNIGWLIYESQWQYVESTTSIEASQDGGVNIVGNGDVKYGTEGEDRNDN